MNPQFTKDHLDYYPIWRNATGGLFLLLHGHKEYKAIYFSIIGGVCHPIDKIEFRDADWMLRLIHKEKLRPTFEHFELVESDKNTNRLLEDGHETNGLP